MRMNYTYNDLVCSPHFSPYLLAQSLLREEGEKYIRGEKCSVKNDMQFENLILADYEIQDFLSKFVRRD